MNTDKELINLFTGVPTELTAQAIELALLSKEQVPCPVFHRFGPGIYIREVHIPAGTVSIGHHQKTEHMNIMLAGRVTMVRDDGSIEELTAPAMYTAKPGRKIGYIHEDMVWLNVYATQERDIEKLEEMFLGKSDSWKENNAMQNALAKMERVADRESFAKFCTDFNMSEMQMEALFTDGKVIELPNGTYSFSIAESPIHGKGIFATSAFAPNDYIAPVVLSGKLTQVAKYINHSNNPTAKLTRNAIEDYDLFALQSMKGNTGGYTGDEITIDYRTLFEEVE